MLKNSCPTTTQSWKDLERCAEKIRTKSILDIFSQDTNRANRMSIHWQDFYVDYSKNILDSEAMNTLYDLAKEMRLHEAMNSYFDGDTINGTEGRAVLHTALRASEDSNVEIEEKNIMPDIIAVRRKIKALSDVIISGEKKGYTGKAFTDVVNIGIGGSDLGPAMVVESLKYYKNHLRLHFVSNIDGDHLMETINALNRETTLFIIVSKTFTTQETLTNAETVKQWFLQKASNENIAQHFVAVSTNLDRVKDFGIHSDNIFPMWDWVGGRFSLWSAVGLSISLAIGYPNFQKFLDGASAMDNHFRQADFSENIPVTLALIGIWYNNFFDSETEAIVPYTQYLNRFVAYLQQAIMESNGKSVNRSGKPINYQTGSIVWGEPGTNAQHAFFQLLHQGTKLIPVDFIGYKTSLYGNTEHHDKLMSNFFAQTEALLTGKSKETVISELKNQGSSEAEIKELMPFKIFSGNKPTNTILIDKLTPHSLGALIALYEHKIFVQGFIWNIYSYDQWGVELGKVLANRVLKDLTNPQIQAHDSSTTRLIEQYKQITNQ